MTALKEIYKNPEGKADVIFVHGLTGDAEKTWTCADSNEFWPEWLKEKFPEFSIYSYGYPASIFKKWAKKEMDMFERAGHMLEIMTTRRLGQRPIVFINHSLGGILTKILLRKSNDGGNARWKKIADSCRLVMFLGTPHHGNSLANALEVLPFTSKKIKLLANDTGFLKELNQHYRVFANNNDRLKTVAYGETFRTKNLFVIVDSSSADPGVADCVPVMWDKDHIHICKPSSREDDLFIAIVSHLSDLKDELNEEKKELAALPLGLSDPSELAGTDGLRGRLREDKQSYREYSDNDPSDDRLNPSLKRLVKEVQENPKPLVITGEGGLGKTRLALELTERLRESCLPALVGRDTNLNSLEQVKALAEKLRKPLLLVLDYIEELGTELSFDQLYEWVTRCEGARLIVTTRRTPSRESHNTGPKKFTADFCAFLHLEEDTFKDWRLKVSQSILKSSPNLKNLFSEEDLAVIDNPAIATLLAYDAEKGDADDRDQTLSDGDWLLHRLKRRINNDLNDIEFATLLSLYPHNQKMAQRLKENPQWSSVMEGLEAQGWVSRGSAINPIWRLGHDLLADIPLTGAILNEPNPGLRVDAIERMMALLPDDIELRAVFARSFARTFYRLIGDCKNTETFSILYAAKDIIALSSPEPDFVRNALIDILGLVKFPLREKVLLFAGILGATIIVPSWKTFIKDNQKQTSEAIQSQHRDLIFFLNLCAQGDPDWRDFLLTYYKVTLSPWQQKQFYENPGRWLNKNDPSYLLTEKSQINKLRAYLSSGDPTQNMLAARFLSTISWHVDEEIWLQLKSYSQSSNPLLSEWIARAMIGQAEIIAELDNDPDAFLPLIEKFGESDHPPVQEYVARAMLNRAIRLANRDNDPDTYNELIEKFGGSDYPPVQESVAGAMFNRANFIARRDNNPDAYLPLIKKSGESGHPAVQEHVAKAMNNRDAMIAERDNDPDAYLPLIEKFAENEHPPVQESVAVTMFNRAVMIDNRDNNSDAYHPLIDKFSDNEHTPVQETLARAMFNRARTIAERDNDPDAFLPLIDKFAENDHPAVQEWVTRAMLARAIMIAECNNDPDAFLPLIEKFAENEHSPVQEHVARAMFNRAKMIAKRDNDPDAYLPLIEKFGESDHPPVQEGVAIAMLIRANMIAERDTEPQAYLLLIKKFAENEHPPVQEQVAGAMNNRALMIAERDNDPDAFLAVLEKFGENKHPPVQEKVAIAMFIRAVMIAKRDSDPNAYLPLIDKFVESDHPPVQEALARAMFSRAIIIAKCDNDPDAYLPLLEKFRESEHPPVQEQVAKAMLARADMIAGRDNDPDAYNELINKFAEKGHPPVLEHVANAMFNRVVMIAERDNDPDAYYELIKKFRESDYPPVQEHVAEAMFNRALMIAELYNNPDAFLPLIEKFAENEHPTVQEWVAMAMYNRALMIADRDNDPDAYNELIKKFGESDHPPVQEKVILAMFNGANTIARRDNDPDAYLPLIEKFTENEHPQIQEFILRAKRNRIGWLVIAGRVEEALVKRDALFNFSGMDEEDKLVMVFLLWLAKPDEELRKRLDGFIRTFPDGKRITWTFEEFAEVIAKLDPEDQAFARRFIRKFENINSGS